MRALVVAVVLALGAAACGGGGSEGSGSGSGSGGQGTRKISIGLPTDVSLVFAPFLNAKQLGYYQQENLDVTFVPTNGSGSLVQLLLAGRVDAAIPTIGPLLTAMDKRQALYPFLTYYNRQVIDFGAPAGGEVHAVADLVGKKVGVSSLAGGEVPVVEYVLEQAGIRDKVQIVAIGEEPAGIVAALKSGRVQALANGNSTFVALKARGEQFTDLLPAELKNSPSVVMTASSSLSKSPEVLEALARASAKGMLFCLTNPTACMEVLEKTDPKISDNPSLSRSTLNLSIQQMNPAKKDGRYVFASPSVEGIQQQLTILSQGSKPVVANPQGIDLNKLVLNLDQKINGFDYDAIVKQAQSYK